MEPKHEDDYYENLARTIVNINHVHNDCTEIKKIKDRKLRGLRRILIRSDYIVHEHRWFLRRKRLLRFLGRLANGSIRFISRHMGIKSDINRNS